MLSSTLKMKDRVKNELQDSSIQIETLLNSVSIFDIHCSVDSLFEEERKNIN